MCGKDMTPEAKERCDEIYREILGDVGNVVTGEPLRRALGFSTLGAMTKAIERKKLPLPLFDMPNRRGKFILARELACFLARQRALVDGQ